MANEILERIASAGSAGIKRIELKKIFGKDCENVLKDFLKKKDIFMEKKGNVYFVWTKENYVSYLSQNDPKFKLILDMVTKTNPENDTKKHIDNMQETMKNLSQTENHDDAFKMEFDKCLTESSTSIGWAPFSQIRKKICESQHFSNEHFYTLASNLLEKHRENYEVSSGGQEGIVMRGLVHGFVRNI